MFRTISASKKIAYINIAALVMLLIGWWKVGMCLFIWANILALKGMREPQPVAEEPVKDVETQHTEDFEESIIGRRLSVDDIAAKRQEKEVRKAQNAKWQVTVEDSVSIEAGNVKPTDFPNGVVVCGPNKKPVLIDFDASGKLENKGTEISMGDWLRNLGPELPDDIVVLVHSVKGDDDMLVKSLEVNRILKDGKKITVDEAARLNCLTQVIEALFEKYVERLRAKQVEQIISGQP